MSRHLHGQCRLYHLASKQEHTTLNSTVPLCRTSLYHYSWKVVGPDCSWHLQVIRQCFAVPTLQWLLQRKLSPTTVCIPKGFCGTKHPSLLLFWHQCLLLRTLMWPVKQHWLEFCVGSAVERNSIFQGDDVRSANMGTRDWGRKSIQCGWSSKNVLASYNLLWQQPGQWLHWINLTGCQI